VPAAGDLFYEIPPGFAPHYGRVILLYISPTMFIQFFNGRINVFVTTGDSLSSHRWAKINI